MRVLVHHYHMYLNLPSQAKCDLPRVLLLQGTPTIQIDYSKYNALSQFSTMLLTTHKTFIHCVTQKTAKNPQQYILLGLSSTCH